MSIIFLLSFPYKAAYYGLGLTGEPASRTLRCRCLHADQRMESFMRALSLYAGMLVISGSICLNPPSARADPAAAGPQPQSFVVDYSAHQAAEPTTLSTSAVLGICML